MQDGLADLTRGRRSLCMVHERGVNSAHCAIGAGMGGAAQPSATVVDGGIQ
jgi:hypothetical protein